MQVFAVFVACLAVASAAPFIPATTLVRAPAHDSAIIRSDRLGGNFAYSTVEGHAYAAITPVVQRVATPVAVSHTVAAPVVSYAAPIALEAPKVEIKTVEAPKAVAYAAPFAAPYAPLAYAHPVALEAPKVEIKTIEAPKTVAYHAPIVAPYAAPFAYAHPVAVETPKVELKTVESPKLPLTYPYPAVHVVEA